MKSSIRLIVTWFVCCLKLLHMADDREILQDAGNITAEIAKAKAETEFEKYRVVQDRLFMSDFDKYMLELEENTKKQCPDFRVDAVLTPYALAVNPELQGKGIGKVVVENILNLARAEHKKAVRLDVLGACKPAERLYISCGFKFVEAKEMYYEDTGWTEFKMFELNL